MTKSLIIIIAISLAAGVSEAQEGEAFKRARAYEPLIIEAAIKHRIDPRLIWTVAYLETRFQPHLTSTAGARGLMQLMPATAARFGVKNIFDPGQSIDAATRYLRVLQEMFAGRLDLILAAYNAGEGAVEAFRGGRSLALPSGKAINPKRIRSSIPPYPETVAYVKNGMAVFKTLAQSNYFSAPHLARLRTIDAPSDEATTLVTVDLEEMPEALRKGSVYAGDEAANKPFSNPSLPKNSTSQSVYSH